MIIALGILLYAVITVLSAGLLLADIQAIGDKAFADKKYRSNLALCCGLALLPPFWFVAVFGTGFCEQGWRLSRRKQ